MKNTLIVTRNEDIATNKAIELFKANKGGLFFSQKQTTQELVSNIGKDFTTSIVTDCATYDAVREKIENTITEVHFIVIDYIQVFQRGSFMQLMKFLNENNIKLIAISWLSKDGQLRLSSDDNIAVSWLSKDGPLKLSSDDNIVVLFDYVIEYK